MKVYISGGITGVPGYYEKFHSTEHLISKLGHTPINPAAINSMLPADTTHEEYMRMSFAMLDMVDAIYMMPGWEKSRGSNMEYGYALAKGIVVIDSEELLRVACGCSAEKGE